MRKLIVFFALLTTSIMFGQVKGSIAGKLTDKEYNNEPLPFANIVIKGTTTGTTSDIDGLYGFDNLSPGSYTLVFSFVGYESQEITVEVVANKVTTVNVPMGASSASLDEVVITTTARKESEAALLLDQKKAVEIKQSIGAEELTRKGIGDAGEAVSKISGISKQRGNSNVYVRGLGDRYQNTTLNNLSLPSTDVNKKNIDLDLFSTDIIENISVSKAYTASFYGDFAAGNVNINSKEYTGKGFLNISLGSGLNTNAIGEDFVRSEGPSYFGYYNRYDHNPFAVILSHGVDPQESEGNINFNGALEGGYTFDFDDDTRLSFFATASFSNGYEYREGEARDFTNVLKTDFPNVSEYDYSTNTTALLNATFKVDNNNTFKYSSLFINSSSDEVGYYGTKGLGFSRDAIASDEGFYTMNVQFNQDRVFVNQVLGSHKTNNDKWNLDWGFGYNKVFSDEPDRKRITLEDYQFALDNDPSTNPIFYTNIPFDNQRFFQSIEDDEYNSFVNLKHTFSDNFKINFGYNGRDKERSFNSIRYGYDIVDRNNTPVLDVNNFNSIFNVQNINIPDGAGLYNLIVLNPINNDIGNTNRPGLPENTYNGELEINAGYLNAEINLGEKWLIVPGVRLESFSQNITYDVINIRDDDPGFRSVYENIFLPSLNIKYALNEDSNLRLALSKTASLPEFKEVAPFVYEDVTVRYGGNPDLLGGVDGNGPTYSEIYNLDLKYEWFLSSGEIFSVAAFAKRINDPVNRVVAADATGTQRYFRTGESADVYGLELELRKKLLKDADDNGVLTFGFNGSYTFTEQDLKNISGTFTTAFNRDTEELEGASKWVFNSDIAYSPTFKNYKPSATLVASYFSDRIYSIGSGSLGNIVEKSVTTLDFVFKSPITTKLDLSVSARNLLNPKISFIRENTGNGDIIINEYKMGAGISASLKYKF
ncbi:TonB-dependent receptor [Subsaxibacter sp. CAU 1640]|uniref:TonB-dependent receptor n=1 Tax=Subsaxibacter sp. CAU 1640 TaxID=2933271 RepID=UPI00200531EB|nr:TonB-dependent receptor [Subsaxibacter sp. CAU 1640]MCK7589248.1 TonB-dependent receptor [Subsaxibacter sp. CAU 1640]